MYYDLFFVVILGFFILIFLSPIFFVNVCVNVSSPFIIYFLMLQGKDQQLHSLHLILDHLIFCGYHFQIRFFYFTYLRISEKNPWKMWPIKRSPLRKFQIIVWDFPKNELPETYFPVFYSLYHYYCDKLFLMTSFQSFSYAILLNCYKTLHISPLCTILCL